MNEFMITFYPDADLNSHYAVELRTKIEKNSAQKLDLNFPISINDKK